MSDFGKLKADPRPGDIPHQETFIQTILIPRPHYGMMTRPQDHIPTSCVSPLPTESQHYYSLV